MKWLQKILVLFFIFFLISCMATPNIRLNAGGVEMELTQLVPMFAPGDVSPDGKYVLTGGWKESGFKLWDISKGAQINKFKAEGTWQLPVYAVFSPNGKYVLSGGKILKLWDLFSGQEIKKIGDLGTVTTPSFSADGSKIISYAANDAATGFTFVRKFGLWDVSDGHEILEFDKKDWTTTSSSIWPYTFGMALRSMALSPDGRYALSGHAPLGGAMFGKVAKMILWNATTGKKIQDFYASEGYLPPAVNSVAFSPDGKHALSGGSDGTIRLWDIISRTELRRLKGHTGRQGAFYVTFSRDGKYILSGGDDGLLKLWDASSGAEIRTYSVYSGSSSSWLPTAVGMAHLLPDGKHIVSGATDGAVRIWDVSTGEEIALLIGFEDGEWLAITSEGYYNSSEKGAQYLKVKFEGTDYTVDQFYDVFYRPDIVAAKLSGQDVSGLISITMKDARKFPPPMVEFTSQTVSADQQKAKICYRVKNARGGIGEVRLFHNGKLIESDGYYREVAKSTSEKTQLALLNSRAIYEDMRGVTVKSTQGYSILTKPKGDMVQECKEIEAIPGDNEVSVAAFNGNNTIQGAMKTVSFSARLKPQDLHLYILSVGIDTYKDGSINLKYAMKDASDIEGKLLRQSATIYRPENIHHELLINERATKENIIKKIDELAKVIRPTDGFILFVAGHGILLQNQYYMLTHEYGGTISEDNTISSNAIIEMSKKIKSLSQLFIFDTCHAGGVDYIVSGLYDARMSVLAKKMGLHIYASASDKQSAMDGYKGNGLFTYTLLDGLNNNRDADRNKDGKVTVVGLGEYSKKMTTNLSKEIGHSQTPLIINFGKDSPIYKLP